MTTDAAGYSGTPQLRKLGIVEGTRLAVLRRPQGWEFAESLPTPVDVHGERGKSAVDVLLAFVTLPRHFDALPQWGERIFPSGSIWVAWPRKAAGHVSDITENLIRERALPLGLVDVKVAAIDNDWSGLKLVWRKELRI